MSSWHSYPKIFTLGHGAIKDLFADPVVIQEKVDGSQFSFGWIDGELKVRSKGKEIVLDAPEKMFTKAVATVRALVYGDDAPGLVPGWTYTGEYLQTPGHNTLTYSRVPQGHIALFDIRTAEETYLKPLEVIAEAQRLGLESVPLLYHGPLMALTREALNVYLAQDSFLGGAKIEGVVVKNYYKFGDDKKALMGKFVSEAFKEVHGKMFRAANPNQGDFVEQLTARYTAEGRWAKARQHLQEQGRLEGSPKDIGALILESQADLKAECEREIRDQLWDWAWPKIARGLARGIPVWYKNYLLDQSIADSSNQALVGLSDQAAG